MKRNLKLTFLKLILCSLSMWISSCAENRYEHDLADIDEFADIYSEEFAVDSEYYEYKISPEVRKNCINGLSRSCMIVGKVEMKNKNSSEAIKYLSMACNLNNVDGCIRLAQVFGKKSDWGQVYAVLEKSCRLGHGKSCSHLGHVILNHRQDETLAISYFIQACHQEVAYTCKQAGLLFYKQGQLKKALPLFAKSCRIDDKGGCYNAAIVESELHNNSRAEEFFHKSCEQKESNGCYNFAVFLGKKSDKLEQAMQVFAKSLELGFKDWHLIEHDLDLGPLRKHRSFKTMVDKYKKKLNSISL